MSKENYITMQRGLVTIWPRMGENGDKFKGEKITKSAMRMLVHGGEGSCLHEGRTVKFTFGSMGGTFEVRFDSGRSAVLDLEGFIQSALNAGIANLNPMEFYDDADQKRVAP